MTLNRFAALLAAGACALVAAITVAAEPIQQQGTVRPPPSLKQPKVSDVPPSSVQRGYDSKKRVTYVLIDIPLSDGSRRRALPGGVRAAGEIDVNFRLEYKGASASDLSAAYMKITFVKAAAPTGEIAAGGAVEVTADAYQYRYDDAVYNTENLSVKDAAPLKGESVTVTLQLEDVQQFAFANQLDVKVGAAELKIKSLQLAEFRRVVLSYNAN